MGVYMYEVHYTGKFYKGLTLRMESPSYSKKITYKVGTTYKAEGFEVSDEACAPGIHIVTSIAQALKWGPVVIEVSVPDGAKIVWTSEKLRTSRIDVVSIVNLSRADLRSADLRGASLSGANLIGADLRGASLSRADLSYANLIGADLSGANLIRADLSRADLSRADLSRASLIGASLSGANLIRANLSRASLIGASLSGAKHLNLAIGLLEVIGEPASLPDGFQFSKGLIAPNPEVK